MTKVKRKGHAEKMSDFCSLFKRVMKECGLSRYEELAPRFENNKSLKKCFGAADRVFAEALLRRLFKEKKQ